MKLIYSHLQKFLPDLKIEPQKLRDDLTMIGHFTNFYEEKEGEIVFDLDIKANRGDCLGYYGLARDLSVFYNLPLTLPAIDFKISDSDYQLPISVTTSDVTRVMSTKISGVTVTQSPDWLVTFVKLHNINSVNNIVDLTNYAMFMYGIPNHAFDAKITTDQLIWENNNGKNDEFTTLDGTVLKLSSQNLVISNPSEVLSTDLVGGQKSGITNSTTDIIIEVATYDRVRIKLDSKHLKTVTEASTRLEKDLDASTIPLAFNFLVSSIIDLAGGQISSRVYDYYPQTTQSPQIEFDVNSPSLVSGISIPTDFALDCLTRLGCTVTSQAKQSPLVTPPSIRKDISQPEDLIEEVVRFWGYQNIPTIQPLPFKDVSDITPSSLYLIELLKNQLVSLGYDEIRSWPLIQEKSLLPNLTPKDSQPIYTQNSINEEYPVLRTSVISSLKSQQDQYQRFKVPNPQFFEIGKVYYQQGSDYKEHYALGLYHWNQSQLSGDIEKIYNTLETDNGNIQTITDKTGCYAEINLEDLLNNLDLNRLKNQALSQPQLPKNHAYELTGQIITLDANVTYDQEQNSENLIKDYSQKIGDSLWQLIIADIYHDQKSNKYRYTFRASYFNLDDKQAKELHLKTFNL